MSDEELGRLAPISIIVPHADDETLGCGGLIAHAVALRLSVQIFYLTDGSASHPGSPSWLPEHVATRRRSEALEALLTLGLQPEWVRFLDWPDSKPFRRGSAAYQATVASIGKVCAGYGVRSILAPWWREAHCDHFAAAQLADDIAHLSAPSCRRLDYLVWSWSLRELKDAPLNHHVWRLPVPDLIERRRQALAKHGTQMGRVIRDAATPFTIAPEMAALVERPSEIFLERK